MGPTPVRDMNVWIDDAGDVPEHDGVVRGAGRGDGAFGHVLLGERPAAGWRRADDGVGQPQRPRGPPRPEDQRREPRVLAHDPRDPQVQGRRPHVRIAHIIVMFRMYYMYRVHECICMCCTAQVPGGARQEP